MPVSKKAVKARVPKEALGKDLEEAKK